MRLVIVDGWVLGGVLGYEVGGRMRDWDLDSRE